MTVPFVDLKIQYQSIKSDITSAVLNTLESAQFALGPQVSAFEDEFAAYCGTEQCVAVNSGTSALHLSLLAAGVGPGDEVITVPFTFVATAAAIIYTGARPVFVDIDPITYTMAVEQIEKAITPDTKAIMPVHLYGQPADMGPIMEIAHRRNLLVIEDAAQAHGAEYNGRRTGGIGDLGCFSFYPGKNLGAYGEGGAITTNNAEYARILRSLRDWGAEKKYHHVLQGYNYRMDGIQGAILRVKLGHLTKWTEARRSHADMYNKLLTIPEIKLPKAMQYSKHVYHVYAIRHPKRDELATLLRDNDIHTGIHYPIPVHLQKAYSYLDYKQGDFPHSEKAADDVLSLPMFPELTEDQVKTVVDVVMAKL